MINNMLIITLVYLGITGVGILGFFLWYKFDQHQHKKWASHPSIRMKYVVVFHVLSIAFLVMTVIWFIIMMLFIGAMIF